MKYNPDKHHRLSIRLKGYDYASAGAYFVTICAWNRECLFGEIKDGVMALNEYGEIAARCWLEIPDHFPQVELDEYVVMPNHVHAIIVITDSVGAKHFLPLPRGTSKTISSIVRGFTIGVTKWFRTNTDIFTVWQRNFYEHVIRNEDDLNRIRRYITDNPMCWDQDEENPLRQRP